MKICSFWKPRLILQLSLAVLVIVIIAGWVTALQNNLPHDDFREDITMAEAQSLVTFPICVPTHIPPGVGLSPIIVYHADDANVPEVTYIRLRYLREDSQEIALEIFERYTPQESIESVYGDESAEARKKVTLLYWIVPYAKDLPESVESLTDQINMDVGDFQTNGTAWWLYEITGPPQYRSTMTAWIKNHTEFTILSYLPKEEIAKVTVSLIECPALDQ